MLLEYLTWSFEGKTLAQSMIEPVHLDLNLYVGDSVKVTIMWGILGDKTIHVLG